MKGIPDLPDSIPARDVRRQARDQYHQDVQREARRLLRGELLDDHRRRQDTLVGPTEAAAGILCTVEPSYKSHTIIYQNDLSQGGTFEWVLL